MATVLVTDAERGSSVAVIRSLGRRGHDVVAASCRSFVPGFHSRHTTVALRHPDPAVDPDGALDALVDAAHRNHVDLVVPVSDEVIVPLSRSRDRLPPGCVLALPEPEALEATLDKVRTLELARSLEVPVPDTEVVSTVDGALAVAGRLGWPLVVKPRRSCEWGDDGLPRRRHVTYAVDVDSLRRAVEGADGADLLLQRHHPGVGRAVSLLADDGRPLAAFQHRRLREVPVTGGASSLRVGEPVDPVLYAMAARLLGELRWTGLAMVELKDGPDGPVLMEINGRVWGALPLAVASGVDFPGRLADLLLAGPPPADRPVDTGYAPGVRSRDLELEQRWLGDVVLRRHVPFGALPSRREALAVGLRLLSPRDGYDILDRHDLRPGLVELAKLASKPVRDGARRLRRGAGS